MEGKKGRIKMLGTYGVEKVVLKFRYTTQREVSMRLANFDFLLNWNGSIYVIDILLILVHMPVCCNGYVIVL